MAPSSPPPLDLLELESAYGEDEPFLDARQRHDDVPRHSTDSVPSPTEFAFRIPRWGVNSPRRIVLMVATAKFFIIFSGMLLVVPYARLVEDALCHAYYKDDSLDIIEEMKCKKDEIQSRMGYLFGWMGLVSSIIGLLVAFPYGMMSDKFGRKPTVIFAYAGVAFSIALGPFFLKDFSKLIRDKPYYLLLGSFFQIFGGGIPVLFSTLYSMASDVSSEEQKATHFLYLTFGSTAGGVLGPVCAGLIMQRFGPWVPIYCVVAFIPFVIAILCLLPETLAVNIKNQHKEDQAPASRTFKQHMVHGANELVYSLRFLKDKSVPMILVGFFVQNAQYAAYSTIMSQYLSKYFGWRLAEVSILLSPLGVFQLFILGGLPKVGDFLMSQRFRMSPFKKDLFLLRISLCILIAASLLQSFSHNIVIFIFGLFISTFGSASNPLARATLTHYVAPEYTSRLFALVGMVEVMGSFIAGPVLAWCFSIGLKRKGLWIGLPWFYISFLISIAAVALVFVRSPKRQSREDAIDSDSDEEEDYMPDDPLRLE